VDRALVICLSINSRQDVPAKFRNVQIAGFVAEVIGGISAFWYN